MTINQIYQSFCENKPTTDQTAVDLRETTLWTRSAAWDSPAPYFWIWRGKISTLCNGVEEEAFEDGFSVGIDHCQAIGYSGAG